MSKTYGQLKIENEAMKKEIAEYKKLEKKYEEAKEKYESFSKDLRQLRERYKAYYSLFCKLTGEE